MLKLLSRLSLLLATATVVMACSHKPDTVSNVEIEIAPSQGEAKVAIVFIHGILGNASTTFRAEKADAGWPQLLATDKAIGAPVYVMSLAYVSDPLGRASNINEIATRLQSRLTDKRVFERFDKVIFVTHSMGGLVAKRMLLQLNHNTPDAYSKVAGIFFLATPAGGSDLAAMAAWVSKNPQFRDMNSEDFNTFLQTEEDDWVGLLRKRREESPYPKVFCAYEKQAVGPVVIVPRSSSQVGCDETPIAFDDRNHIDLVKPLNTNDEVYEYVAARIGRILKDEYVPFKVSVDLLSSSSVPLPSNARLRSGDKYALSISATKPAWFYVFAEDSGGKMERYFPAKETGKQSALTTAIRLPIDTTKVFMLDSTHGMERIYVIASSNSRADLDNLGKEVTAAQGNATQVLTQELKKLGATVVKQKDHTVTPNEPLRLEITSFGTDGQVAILDFFHDRPR